MLRRARWLCCVVSVSGAFVFPARQPVPLRGGFRELCTMSANRDNRGEGMHGMLFQYKGQLQAFESGPPKSERKLVVLGGLSDGMLACPYVPEVAAALAEDGGWSVVQPNLRSSYMQWGFSSLDEDVEDLTALLDFLVARRGAKSLAICGHSTGSQIIAHLMRTRQHAAVSHVILQGGVSDRESDDQVENLKRTENLSLARTIVASSPLGGAEMMPRATTWAPVTAQRYIDLNSAAGSDDYFSSDLSDAELQKRFGGFYTRTNVLIAYSAADEYVPTFVDKELLLRRLCAAVQGDGSADERGAAGRAKHASARSETAAVGMTTEDVPVIAGVLIKGGDHALYSAEAADEFVRCVTAFLNGRPVPGAVA